MRALAVVNNDRLEVVNIEKPSNIQDDEVLIEIKYSTFCKDDMRFNDNGEVFGKNNIVGHEASGIIIETGEVSRISGFKEGDKVILLPVDFCGNCVKCQKQEYASCNELKPLSGTMTKYVVRKYKSIYKFNDTLSFKEASLIEPVATVVKSINQLKIDYDKNAMVIGGGFMGLLFVKLLKMRGIYNVVLIEPLKERREKALAIGADFAFSPDDKNLDLKLFEASDYYGFDFVVETSSNIDALKHSLKFIARSGTLVIFSHYGLSKKISFLTGEMLFSNVTIVWSTLFNVKDFTSVSYLIKSLNLTEYINKECNIEESIKGAEEFKEYKYYKVGVNDFE